jgi:hypothetical protein
MDIDGVLLFLFLALTLPTAVAWFAFRVELIHAHASLFLRVVSVIGMVAVCAGVPFESVHVGTETGQILERFSNAFGFAGVILALGVGIGAGELGASVWEKD